MQGGDIIAMVFNTKISEKEKLFKSRDNDKTKANEDKQINSGAQLEGL